MKLLMKDISSKLMFSVLKSCMIFTMIYLFLPERMKIEKSENFVAKCMTKKNISYT